MSDKDLTRAEVVAFMKMRDMQPSHYKMGRQLLRCMDERDTAREYAGEVRIREKVADDARIKAEAKLAKAVKVLEEIAGNGNANGRNPQLMSDKARAALTQEKPHDRA